MKKLLVGLLALGSISSYSQIDKNYFIIQNVSANNEIIKISCEENPCENIELSYAKDGELIYTKFLNYDDLLEAKEQKKDLDRKYVFNDSFWNGGSDYNDNDPALAPATRGVLKGTSQKWKDGHELEVIGRYALTPLTVAFDAFALITGGTIGILSGEGGEFEVTNNNPEYSKEKKTAAKKMIKLLKKSKQLKLKRRKFEKMLRLFSSL